HLPFAALYSLLRFQFGELFFDILGCLPFADYFLAITLQEIIDRLDANPDRTRRFVFVEILEAEIRRTRLLDDSFDHAIDRRVVSAFEAGNFERHQIRMARRKLRCPNFVVGAARVGILPSVSDVERTGNDAGANFFAEQALKEVVVKRQRVLREDRVAELLELVENFVVEAWVVMVGTRQHDDSNAILALELVEHLARTVADTV